MQHGSGTPRIDTFAPLQEEIRAIFPCLFVQESGAYGARQASEYCGFAIEHAAAFHVRPRSEYLEGSKFACRTANLVDFAVLQSLKALDHFASRDHSASAQR